MKIGIIGSGIVGQTLGAKLAQMGHDVALGTRDPKKLDDKKGMGTSLAEWMKTAGANARVVTFSEAASHGEVLINASHGQSSVDALNLAGADKAGEKVLIDTANELDLGQGMPPKVLASQERCLAERIQQAFPNLKVVKAFNMMTAPLMVDPKMLKGGDHTFLICGNDMGAKTTVTGILKSFGWSDVLDLGDLSAARGCEMYLGLWIRLWGATQTPMLNIKVVR